MNAKIGKIAFVLAVGLFASAAIHAQKAEFLSGDRIDYDDATGHTVVFKARIAGGDGLALLSGKAQFTVDENETPRSIELTGGVNIQVHEGYGTADRAVFYPELQLLSAQQISFERSANSSTIVSPSAMVSYTCSSGTLYADGVSTGGSSVCFGYTEIGCTGSGGNTVYMVMRPYSCPLG